MLTKTDLDQIGKLVRKVIRQEVETEVKDSTRTLDSQIRISRMAVQNDINGLNDRMKNIEISMDDTGKDMKGVKKDLKYIRKTVDTIVKNYDEGDVKLDRRIKKIEQNLTPHNIQV